MITRFPAESRGRTRLSWLDSAHTFSFGHFYDPSRMGFRSLRVINDDRVAPGAGFPTHPHRDAEIVSYVLAGGLAHKDSMGHGSTIRPGEIQRMSAGTGVTHSEYNASETEPVRFLQIWFTPDTRGVQPGYEQRAVPPTELRGRLRPIIDPQRRAGAVAVHQDVTVLATLLEPGEEVTHTLQPGRHGWVQVATGSVALGDLTLSEGDGASLEDVDGLTLRGLADTSEVLVFDLA